MSIDTEQPTASLADVIGWSPAALEDTLAALAKAHRELRESEPDHPERVLRDRWRAQFSGEHAGFLDQPYSFLMIAAGVRFTLSALRGSGAEPSSYDVARLLRKGGIYPEYLAAKFFDQGTPLNDVTDKALVSVIMTATEPVMAVLRWRSGLGVDALGMLCLAAHALNAPDAVWDAIARVHQPGTLSDPNRTAAILVAKDRQLRAEIVVAEKRAKALADASRNIQATLEQGMLDDRVTEQLRSEGISTAAMRDLIRHQAGYQAAGMLKKMLMGSAEDLVQQEARSLLGRWRAVRRTAESTAEDLRHQRATELANLCDLVEPFSADRWPPIRRQQDTYVGDRLAEFGEGDTGRTPPRTMWTVRALPGHDWADLPFLDHFNRSNVLFTPGNGLSYEVARRAVVGIVLDQMSRTRPRRLRLTWLDPHGRGQSAGPFLELLEIDKNLIDGAVWSEPEDIDAALRRVSSRLSEVEQRFLKDTYDDLDAYNANAGQLAEPHHIVVATGFPRGFTDDSAQRLRQISEAGARAGISTLVVTSPTTATTVHGSSGVLPIANHHVTGQDGEPHVTFMTADRDTVFVPCRFAEFTPTAASAIVAGYARASKDAANVKVEASRLVETDPGVSRSTAHGADIPIGIRGRGELVTLGLGRELCHNVLVGGLPGSGKSTLFHTLITSAVRKYPPEELELYLLDFKQGVEFQPYAEHELPHARVVAVESERDFGLSVLRRLRDEITQRALKLRGPGGAGSDGIAEYRDRTQAVMPRVLVVIDEFQVLFADDDRVAHESAQLLDHVVRQGRAFGVHLVLGTQTLRGHGAMSLLRGTLDQIAVRIVLKTSDADSRLFLADDNPAGFQLDRPGKAIYNADGGRPEGNIEFQVAHIEDEERDAVIEAARDDAEARGLNLRPWVFDGTRPVDVWQDEDIAALIAGTVRLDGKRLRMHLGLPVALGGSGAVDLRRMSGAHLVIIHRDPGVTMGTLLVALTTARLSTPALNLSIIDCLGVDEDHADDLARLPATSYQKRSRLSRVLGEVYEEVRRRVRDGDYRGPRLLLVVNALHRARDLGDENTFAEPDSPREHLLAILRDGADVGVHVVVTADSVDTLERRLGSAALGEFGSRLLGQCSPDASQRVVGSASASRLGDRYALLHEPDEDRLVTVRPFPAPDEAWLAAAGGEESR